MPMWYHRRQRKIYSDIKEARARYAPQRGEVGGEAKSEVVNIKLLRLHLVEDGLGELVRGRLAAHVAGADLAVSVCQYEIQVREGLGGAQRADKRTRRQ